MPRYSRSQALHERACQVLAGGVSSEFRRFSDPHPLFFARGQGSHIVDVDDNDYLDFTLSQGPLILGHSHPRVLEAVARASAQGQLFAGQHEDELELAETIQRLVPCAERVRFSLSGSEANHAALRLARCVTNRPWFIRFEGHYHGWFDNVAFGLFPGPPAELGPREEPNKIPWTQGLPKGAADECLLLPWNDLSLVEKSLAQHAGDVAAIITEPIMCNSGCIEPEPGFLDGLRTLCDAYGIVLIFDEVITGFRLGLGGAQKHFGVVPDLAVFGKALASGYPISVLAGKEEFMRPVAEGRVIHAGTMNSGNPSVAAALATLAVLEDQGVHERLFRMGARLMLGLRDVSRKAGRPLLVSGPGPMFHAGFSTLDLIRDFRDTLSYDKPLYAAFVRGMQDRDIRLIGRGLWYLSAAHTDEEIGHAISEAGAVLDEL